jgi:hypothetical protein
MAHIDRSQCHVGYLAMNALTAAILLGTLATTMGQFGLLAMPILVATQ